MCAGRQRKGAAVGGKGRGKPSAGVSCGGWCGGGGGGERQGEPGNEGMRATLLIRVYLPLAAAALVFTS